MKARSGLIAGVVAITACFPATANAAVDISILEVGSNVVATSTGSLNLTGLILQGGYINPQALQGNTAFVATGMDGTLNGYSGFTGPASFGSGGIAFGTGTGSTIFGINGGSFAPTVLVFVTPTYISGSAIASTLSLANSTFASLGLTPGTYRYVSANDTVTVTIGSGVAAVPEPASWAMMIAGFAGIGFAMRRRRRASVHASVA